MQKIAIRSLVIVTTVLLAACSHDSEMANIGAPERHYVLQSQRGAEQVTTAGFVSRYQRDVITVGLADNPNASPQSQYFDDVMDHLETLMTPQIVENNRIAMLQEKEPGYRF